MSDKRLSEDGRINFADTPYKFDIRVSILPNLHGEKVVLRLLNNDATNISLERLGLGEPDISNYLEGVQRHSGRVLISGPTRSGKPTTTHATWKLLKRETRKIHRTKDTIENKKQS